MTSPPADDGVDRLGVMARLLGTTPAKLAGDPAAYRTHAERVRTATAALAAARPVQSGVPARIAPATLPWQQAPVIAIGPPMGPVFAQHFEYRPTGALPFVGGSEATAAGWVREKSARERFDACAVIGHLDAWWPAIYGVETMPRPCATVAFTAELLTDPATLPIDRPLFHSARVEALSEGYFVELRELWSGSTLVALNQQTFAILR